MATTTTTHLPPESSIFDTPYGGEIQVLTDGYIQRPETVESYYYLHVLTHDDKYRQWSWDFFTAIERYTRTPEAYSTIASVMTTKDTTEDSMQTFFLAETLKYIYLSQDEGWVRSGIDLEKYVFNTEAHPLKLMTGSGNSSSNSSNSGGGSGGEGGEG